MKFLNNEKVRYLLVGGYNTAFGYLLFALLLMLFENRVHYLIVLVISHVISVTNAYLSYKFLVFKTEGKWLYEFLKFNTVYLGVFLINLVALPAMVELLSIRPVIGQSWFVVVTVIVSYFGHKHFSFKDRNASRAIMNTVVSPITTWLGRLNYRRLLLLHFVISSVGLIKLAMVFAGLVDHMVFKQLVYVQAGLSDWAGLTGMSKHTSLLEFVLSVVALFSQYTIFIVLSKVFAPALTRLLDKEQLSIIAFLFLTVTSVNGILLLTPPAGELRFAILAALWLVSYLWLAFYSVQNKLHVPAMSNLAWRILLTVMAIQYAAIFTPLITEPMQIENDYLNIPDSTMLKSGQVVDNLAFINEHQIAGFQLFDPRKDGSQNSPVSAGTSVQMENCQLVYRYLRAINKEYNYKYSCDDETNTLIVRPPMTLDDKSALDKLQLSTEDRMRLDELYISSVELANESKKHVYSEDEKDFIGRNDNDLQRKTLAGWFFYHHNYYFGPMAALSLGATQYSQAMVYGWLNTVTVGALLDRFGMMNYQGYFKVFFASYLVYFAIFLLGIWAIFRRLGLVLFAAVLSISALFLLGIEYIRLAPGFNPLRHIFDILVFYLFYRYLSQERKSYLIFACVLALFAILWSKDFGLFLSISIGAATLLRLLNRRPIQRFPLFMGGITILAALLLYFYPVPGANPTAIYMILGVGSPPTPPEYILGALMVIGMLLVMVILIKQKEHYQTLTIALLLYSVQSITYFIWYPSWHHILAVAPVHILLLVALFHGWITRDQDEKNISRRQTVVLVPLLLLMYLPVAAYFYWKQHSYYQTFKNHPLYDWSFEKASFMSIMDPSLFVEAVNLINQHSQKDKGIFLVSKYDHILPILAGKYSAMPYNELPTNLVSQKEIEVAAGAILKNKPAFLFVDQDIGRSLNGEIPAENDPATIYLSLYGEARSRVMVMQGLNYVYARVADKYVRCKSGRLISVYCRKPD